MPVVQLASCRKHTCVVAVAGWAQSLDDETMQHWAKDRYQSLRSGRYVSAGDET